MERARITDEDIRIQHYRHVHVSRGGYNEPRWRGITISKFPQDMLLYAQVIWKRKPDYIIETGTRFGGSALFFGDMLLLSGGKKVFTIDVRSWNPPAHPMVEYLLGSSVDPEIVSRICSRINGSVMVSLDSDHSTNHVAKELSIYHEIVTSGQYLVVEDCWTKRHRPYSPYKATQEFLKSHKEFRRVNVEKQFIFAVTRDGWLIKR